MLMASLITFTDVQLAFGHHALLDHANFAIAQGERVGLIGRNGAGKSSMLKILDSRIHADDGEVTYLNGIRVVTVEQEPKLDNSKTIFENLLSDYIEAEDWERSSKAEQILIELGLDGNLKADGLSGGTNKKIALATSILKNPDLLLLDEPTNHLDFESIIWLEGKLKNASFALLVITHDRRFLDEVTTRIIELDRGKLYSFPGNFSQWQVQKEASLKAEEIQNSKFDKFLAQEEVWIRKGIEARRTRNEGRVRRLEALRRERAERRDRIGNVNFKLSSGEKSGKLVAELENVSFSFGSKEIVRNFSTKIFRGDRIGIIGPNAAGKTTLLRIILGQLNPNSGTVRLGTNLEIAYFDQMRNQLDEQSTLADVISPGSEWVEIGGTKKHIMGYLGDFLFDPARANSPVSSLSGGERARLLLARLFARPANVLVLDEPTNDLDIETLELLEELLQTYTGTVLLVSHDRVFLDNVITQTIAYDGNATWTNYVGGYEDYVRQRPSIAKESPPQKSDTEIGKPKENKPKNKSKLSSFELKELEELPQRISDIEGEISKITEKLSDPSIYEHGPQISIDLQAKITELEVNLETLYEKWNKLESKI
ncbi:ATP-binding cassette domain-containing protein [Taylorella equigenitalis]|nr:ATP-binding cassette domain-containing protein [Taylorella equigenitalis]WDU47132.1 ATP-binding cassette domain-containing protein [Taylorella equigenitalis]WDU52607.1 ATP-binding cassette domain-containing protein [Taylorella equigenitalis]WDU54084.1 ATP-binding cassette domain-containing protein [Taylorella equigenitalis]WDU55574.1 ATP-binding cassette domain-containing protein [Taylorella equigenitalis]